MKPLDQLKKEAEAHCWQDISMAPKDGGASIIVRCDWNSYAKAVLTPYGREWLDWRDNPCRVEDYFTHWKPLDTPDSDIIKDLLATIEVMEGDNTELRKLLDTVSVEPEKVYWDDGVRLCYRALVPNPEKFLKLRYTLTKARMGGQEDGNIR